MTALLLAAALSFAPAYADDVPIPVSQLPPPVLAALQDYFPGSVPISAERDEDGRRKYEVKIRYKAIVLEVDLTSSGRILDVDMDN